MKIYTFILTLLLLTSCSAIQEKTYTAFISDKEDIPLCDCRPYPKPNPFDIKPIKPKNVGNGIWQLDDESYLNNAKVWKQTETNIEETEGALNYWYECVAKCNERYKKINKGE